MRAAFFEGNRKVVIKEIPIPEAGVGEVVVKVKYCGICGSELDSFLHGESTPPHRAGHEAMGIVTEVGDGVSGWMKGDRTTINIPSSPCGECYECRHGLPEICSNQAHRAGAYAEYINARASQMVHIPDEVTDEEATLVEPLGIALHAIRRSGIKLGDSVGIIGAGPIGLMLMQAVRQAGAMAVYVTERSEGRFKMAVQLGADKVFNPRNVDVCSEIVKETGRGTDIVFDCAGTEQTLPDAVRIVARGGKIVLINVPRKMMVENLHLITFKQLNLIASQLSTDEFVMGLELIRRRKIKVKPLISGIIPLEELEQTLKSMESLTSQIKVLVKL
jgi:(R,R)-butanediol dehydrogenase / meso-butanediol dehydrogenase / diacetyl reductase